MADGDNRIIGTPIADTEETTDNTPTVLCSVTIAANRSIFLVGKYVGQNVAGAGSIVGGQVIAVANVSAGSAVVQDVDAPSDMNLDPATLGYTVTFTASSAKGHL